MKYINIFKIEPDTDSFRRDIRLLQRFLVEQNLYKEFNAVMSTIDFTERPTPDIYYIFHTLHMNYEWFDNIEERGGKPIFYTDTIDGMASMVFKEEVKMMWRKFFIKHNRKRIETEWEKFLDTCTSLGKRNETINYGTGIGIYKGIYNSSIGVLTNAVRPLPTYIKSNLNLSTVYSPTEGPKEFFMYLNLMDD